jgi:hypothetical protein
MATITTDVEVDLDDFATWELREELEYRGYYVTGEADIEDHIEKADDDTLVTELIARGYTVYGKMGDLPWELYQAYLLESEKDFRETVAKILSENGYRP